MRNRREMRGEIKMWRTVGEGDYREDRGKEGGEGSEHRNVSCDLVCDRPMVSLRAYFLLEFQFSMLSVYEFRCSQNH